MNIEKLSRLDLNLLVCLQVLMQELSVTRTAHRLCLSQSAVSKSLAKLREQFNDPLFTEVLMACDQHQRQSFSSLD